MGTNDAEKMTKIIETIGSTAAVFISVVSDVFSRMMFTLSGERRIVCTKSCMMSRQNQRILGWISPTISRIELSPGMG